VKRAWITAASGRPNGVSDDGIHEKLKFTFEQASTFMMWADVDWTRQPTPIECLQRERHRDWTRNLPNGTLGLDMKKMRSSCTQKTAAVSNVSEKRTELGSHGSGKLGRDGSTVERATADLGLLETREGMGDARWLKQEPTQNISPTIARGLCGGSHLGKSNKTGHDDSIRQVHAADADRRHSASDVAMAHHAEPSVDMLFFEDKAGYDVVPSTACRDTVPYRRIGGGTATDNIATSQGQATGGSGVEVGQAMQRSGALCDDATVGDLSAGTDDGCCSTSALPTLQRGYLPLSGVKEEKSHSPELRPPICAENLVIEPGAQKFYAIRRGHKPGVYTRWQGPGQAEEQVKGFKGNAYKSFPTLREARGFVYPSATEHTVPRYNDAETRRLQSLLQPHINRAQQQVPAETLPGREHDRCAAKSTSEQAPPDGVVLNEEQQALVDLVLSGQNVFYTGSAGTGKSATLHHFVAALRAQGKRVAVVSPSGIAALNVNGETYFTFAGWTPDSKKKSIKVLEQEAKSKQRWQRLYHTDVLVIDEISMMEAHQFQRLDCVCRAARVPRELDQGLTSVHDPNLPFGGIQVVVTGDFCQLPPVCPFSTCFPCGKELPRRGPKECSKCGLVFLLQDQWPFRSPTWESCSFVCVRLKKIYRQSDPTFINILDTLSSGKLPTLAQLDILLNHACDVTDAVRLFPRNAEADRINREALASIPNEPTRNFHCHDGFQENGELHPYLRSRGDLEGPGNITRKGCKDHRFQSHLEMKVGMLVMLVANINIEAGLVNGSQGRLVSFKRYDPDTFELPSAMGEVAEYREDQVQKWIGRQERIDGEKMFYPVVRFANGLLRTIYPVCQVSLLGDKEPYSKLSRTQVPLIPAWAITIHKSQGLTMDKVIVNLDANFEREMVYAALSRARSLRGLRIDSEDRLQVLRDPERLGGANRVVQAFMEKCSGKPKTVME